MFDESIQSVYCDCCHRIKLAEIRDGKVIISKRVHDVHHTATVVLASTVVVLTAK